MNGLYKDYFLGINILKEEGLYKNGKKEGEWFMYNEEGTLLKTVNYKAGVIQERE